MIRLIIFDFDGVIMNSEPLHFAKFNEVLKEEGLSFDWEEYRDRYLAYNDRDCFRHVLEDKGGGGGTYDDAYIAGLVARKSEKFDVAMKTELRPVDGTPEFIRRVATGHRLAIASGALRHEIEALLDQHGLREFFPVIVGADDVKNGKPAPDAFLAALDQTNELIAGKLNGTTAGCERHSGGGGSAFASHKDREVETFIKPDECLVIEDAPLGLKGAVEAGMHTVGITTNYPAAKLTAAERVVGDLSGLSV